MRPSFGLGSQVVGSTTALGKGGVYCETCPRCGGAGRKPPMLIAGTPTGGDTPPWLCYLCRGAGARVYVSLRP